MATRYTQDQDNQGQRGGPNRGDTGDQMTRSGPRPGYGDGQVGASKGVGFADDDDLFASPLSAWEQDDDDQTRYAQGRFTDDDEDLGAHGH